MEGCGAVLGACDLVVYIAGWLVSIGSLKEHSWMKREVYVWLDHVVKRATKLDVIMLDLCTNGIGGRRDERFCGVWERRMLFLNLRNAGVCS